eukprot:TRINITY_DN16391_c0_g1_i1.p1 TRINITY_DN16391_c0_g1~~TRINITY_DN16391_c0_g1_i1.p1  ORF type:complete len:235 (+),score=22.08 TRINITY_DN16391_c0_g1_i1:52-705(+)
MEASESDESQRYGTYVWLSFTQETREELGRYLARHIFKSRERYDPTTPSNVAVQRSFHLSVLDSVDDVTEAWELIGTDPQRTRRTFDPIIMVVDPLTAQFSLSIWDAEPSTYWDQHATSMTSVQSSGGVAGDCDSVVKLLVLSLTSAAVSARHDYGLSLGARHKFATYSPHVTLASNVSADVVRRVKLGQVPVPTFRLEIAYEHKQRQLVATPRGDK